MKVYCHKVPGSVMVIWDYYTNHNGYKVHQEKEMWVVMDD